MRALIKKLTCLHQKRDTFELLPTGCCGRIRRARSMPLLKNDFETRFRGFHSTRRVSRSRRMLR